MTTAVTQLPDYIQKQRLVASIKTEKKGDLSIYNVDGTINATGNIKNWNELSLRDKKLVMNEQKRLGVKFKGKGGKGGNEKSHQNTIQQLKNQARNLKRTIKSLKSSGKEEEEQEDNPDDAGDEFGGKVKKKKG